MNQPQFSADFLELQELVRSSLLPAAAALYLSYPEGDAHRLRHRGGGSACTISTPHGDFWITCEHVLTGMQRAQEQTPGSLLVGTLNLWPLCLDPITIITCDEEWDIAVFQAPKAHNALPPPSNWVPRWFKPKFPLEAPQAGDEVVIFGFPGEGRIEGQQDHVFIGAIVDDVSDRKCVLMPENPRVVSSARSNLLRVDSGMGGISGGPVFLLRDGVPSLCGLVSNGERADGFIMAALLHTLQPDGKIRPLCDNAFL